MIDADVKSATLILFICCVGFAPSRTQVVQRHECLVEDARVDPHEPEIGLEERGIELIRDAASAEHGFRLDRQTLDRQDVFFAEAELGASCLWPSRTSRDLDDVFIVSFHAKISCVTVLLPSSVRMEENSS